MRADDERAFEEFVARTADRQLRSAVLLTGGDWAAAEDLVQGAFERIYLRWGKVGAGQEDAYLRRTVVNAATSRWRRLRARVSVYGVSIGWLPDGMVAAISQFQDVVGLEVYGNYLEQKVWFADAAAVGQVRSGAKTAVSGPQYTVSVRRGTVPTAEQIVELGRRGGDSVALETVTAGGHPASIVRSDRADSRWPTMRLLILGDDPETSTVVSGPDRDTVLRIGTSVTIGPAPVGPARRDTAVAQIRSAVAAAFAGSSGVEMLKTVADDGYAHAALGRALATAPGPVTSVTVKDVGPVVFFSATEAEVSVTLGLPYGVLGAFPQLVYADGGWRVTRASYCTFMHDVIPGCPTVL